MVFQPGAKPVPKLKEKKDNCVIDIKKTKSGKRVSFKGNCSREQLRVASSEAGVEFSD